MRQPPRKTPELARPNPIPPIEFPEALPVSARRDDIAAALATHQAIVVCGETGSGKTTQLPKIALAMGRGRANGGGLDRPHPAAPDRRLERRPADRRGAEDAARRGRRLQGPLPGPLSAGASVKLMTDGILLAETQSDPLLRAYDTIIVDEAHERSLNIDFLLGHLRQILPRRPDLKVVVTSATIDAERFAQHFASKDGPAPVLQVSGRLYPVEIRWRPFVESRDHDLGDAICDAVDELGGERWEARRRRRRRRRLR
jgi:ATP-dependent helicase HrpA